MELKIYGSSEQAAEYKQAEGRCVQEQHEAGEGVEKMPSADNPSEITPSIPAGTYSMASGGKLYELTLPDMYGCEEYADKFVFDAKSGRAWVRQECCKNYLPADMTFNDWASTETGVHRMTFYPGVIHARAVGESKIHCNCATHSSMSVGVACRLKYSRVN